MLLWKRSQDARQQPLTSCRDQHGVEQVSMALVSVLGQLPIDLLLLAGGKLTSGCP